LKFNESSRVGASNTQYVEQAVTAVSRELDVYGMVASSCGVVVDVDSRYRFAFNGGRHVEEGKVSDLNSTIGCNVGSHPRAAFAGR